MDDVTVLVAAHPARLSNGLLDRALQSISRQTLQPEFIMVSNDKGRLGAGANRRKLLGRVTTKWTAWLDSDDTWYPEHLEKLMLVATSAPDIAWVYSWFDGGDPLGHFGVPFNPCSPHHTTMNVLERTGIAQEAGFCDTQAGPYSNEDWYHITQFANICCDRDLRMVHLAERTWTYHQAGQNSSGKPGQGDA